MTKQNLLMLLALIAAFALVFTGCGNEEAPAASQPLGLADWSLSTSTWSSPNGATVHLTAHPTAFTKADTAEFLVRLEGDEIDRSVCTYDGTVLTASLDLNAADGYCYYVILTAKGGAPMEIAVNTPTNVTDDATINLAAALEAYCAVTVTDGSYETGFLSISSGTALIQLPRITNNGEAVTCTEAVLILSNDAADISQIPLELGAPNEEGCYTLDLAGASFQIDAPEDDQQLLLRLDATLSNGQSLSAPGVTWYALDGQLQLVVG